MIIIIIVNNNNDDNSNYQGNFFSKNVNCKITMLNYSDATNMELFLMCTSNLLNHSSIVP